MKYDIILRPHHVKAYINFIDNGLYKLSKDEYVNHFKNKNKGYHNIEFIIFWRNFLLKLHNDNKIIFLYKNDYDIVCDKCDIRKECDNENTKLYKLVRELDKKNLEELRFIEGDIYRVSEILKLKK